MKDLIKYYELPIDIKSVLIVGDTNYYKDTDIEVEVVSSNDVVCHRLVTLENFLNKRKRLIYFKYNTIILEQAYIESMLSKLVHLMAEEKFHLSILIDNNYKIEDNYEIISLFENPNFDSKIIERENDVLIVIKRWNDERF